MPRGLAAGTHTWNFRVKRLVCPFCHRRGLYVVFYPGGKKYYCCMYSRGYKQDCASSVLIDENNELVLLANPELK